MKSKRMASISFDPRFGHPAARNYLQHGGLAEEIEGLIKVYKDGFVERMPVIPSVPCTMSLDNGVSAGDAMVDKLTNLWARIYVGNAYGKLPLLVYFHGGGFCVGSAAWSCYHEFLCTFASKAKCVIISVNYRLAPENRLPAAYEDGFKSLLWLKQQILSETTEHKWWTSHCNLSSLFLAGDSAGANIAYNVATQLGTSDSSILRPLSLKGLILMQPFFGGETRTASEKYATQPPNSALTLSVSDTYWRLSLPPGANKDHPWCNPLTNGQAKLYDLMLPTTMVCISEMDILKDRNLEFCASLARVGKKVETLLCKGVGHAFQVLHNSPLTNLRTQEMISRVLAFLNR